MKKEGNAYVPCPAEEAEVIAIRTPGPLENRHIPVILKGKRQGTGCWTWNGDIEKPTLRPSVLSDFRPHDALVCHSWITDGQIQFLNDSTHEFSGQTLDLLDVEN